MLLTGLDEHPMYDDILNFWFEETPPALRWKKDPAFDARITERFAQVHARAARCELFGWRSSARGRLAEIIVLDQFSRNMFRDSAQAFAQDPLALALAQEAISLKLDLQLSAEQRSFLYMPFMHSESLLIHKTAIELFVDNAIADNLNFELKHKAIIERFGRYPHRNALLGRASTALEIEFLQQPGSSF